MKSSGTDHRTTQGHEGLVDIVPFVEASTQTTKLMQQCQGLLDYIAKDSQATAIRRVASGDDRDQATLPEFSAMRLRVVTSIRQHALGFTQRRSRFTRHGWQGIHQGKQLRHIVAM